MAVLLSSPHECDSSTPAIYLPQLFTQTVSPHSSAIGNGHLAPFLQCHRTPGSLLMGTQPHAVPKTWESPPRFALQLPHISVGSPRMGFTGSQHPTWVLDLQFSLHKRAANTARGARGPSIAGPML